MSAIRTSLLRQARLFSTTPIARKTVTETAKDTLKKVDRVVSDAAVKGIETGEQAVDAVKSTVASSEVKGKAEELTGKAKGAAAETKGKVVGKTEEVKGQMKS